MAKRKGRTAEEQKRKRERESSPEYKARRNARLRARYDTDPEFASKCKKQSAHTKQSIDRDKNRHYQNEWFHKNKEEILERRRLSRKYDLYMNRLLAGEPDCLV